MITLIEATNSQGSVLDLPLDDVSNGLVVEEVEGLDPVKATIVSSGFAQLNGVQYQSSKREQRDIKIKIGLEPDYATNTVAKLRKRLYNHFMPESTVTLRFYDDEGLEVLISGMVETCEAPQFVEEPQMDVVIACFDPDFWGDAPVVVAGNSVADTTEMTIDYAGSLETGIVFTLNVNRALPQFTLYHRPPDGTLRTLDFNTALQSGDKLTISTIPGSKFATLTRAGVDTSVLYGVSPQSSWIEMRPGLNAFRVYATGAAIPFTIQYTNKYGGL